MTTTTPPVMTTTDELIAEISAEMENAEQAAFEDWLEQKCPSGDADSVHAQWKDSAEFSDLRGDYPYVSELLARIRELEEAQRWVPVTERLPEPGLLVQVYSPPQPGDWPDTVRIDTDGIDPESEDYWVGHGEHYERYCMIAKGGDVEWTGPAEKAPYTHWKQMPEPPQ